MPWTPLPKIAFAIATYPFNPTTRDDLPLELGDELYIIEQCADGQWYRGYLVAPPSLLAGLSSVKGQTLEARVFSGIFPAVCVDIKEYLATEIPQQAHIDQAEELDGGDDADGDGLDGEDAIETETDDGKSMKGRMRESTTSTQDLAFAESGYELHVGMSEGEMITGGLGAPPRRKANRFSEFGNTGGHSGSALGPNGIRHDDASSVKSRKEKRNRRRITQLSQNSHSYRNQNRVRPAAPVPMLKVGDETSSFESEPLIDEIASCLREWYAANIHELLLGRQYPLLDQISTLVQGLDMARRQLLHNVLTKAELVAARESTVWALVKGNKLLSREVIVRHPGSGRILTGEDSSVEITTLQSQMSLLDAPPVVVQEGATLHHLLLDLKAFVGMASEPTTLVFYLATKTHIPISESFTVELSQQGVPVDASQIGQLQTLFLNLSTRDTAEEIYLVARVYTIHNLLVGAQQGHRDREALTQQSNSVGQQQQKDQPHPIGSASPNPPRSSGGTKEPKLSGRISVLFSPKPNGRENQFSPIQQEKGARALHQKGSIGNLDATIQNGSVGRKTKSRDGKSDSESSTHSNHGSSAVSAPKKVEFRKALGVGVLDVGRFIRQEAGTEQVMRIFVPVGTGGGTGMSLVGGSGDKGHGVNEKSKSGGGEDWDRLVKDVIESRTSKL